MNTNVISQFAIECFEGSLRIIGKDRDAVVLCLRGNTVDDLKGNLPLFCENPIFTNDVETHESILIFEYGLREGLRNPRKLLKSIRNKLVQAGFRNRRKKDKEFNEMYSMSDREEHRMWAEMSKSSV